MHTIQPSDPPTRTSEQPGNPVVDRLLAEFVQTEEGRRKLLASMVHPARLRMEYCHRLGQTLCTGSRLALPARTPTDEETFKFEETFKVDWEALRQKRYGIMNRCMDLIRAKFGAAIDQHLFGMIREIKPPLTEEFPSGWRLTVMAPETFGQLLGTGAFYDSDEEPDALRQGLSPDKRLRGSLVGSTKGLDPGLLYAFGEQLRVGEYHYDLTLADLSDDDHFIIGAKVTGHILLYEDPAVAIYVLG